LAREVECLSRTEETSVEDFAPFAAADSRIDDLLSATLEELVDLFNAEATIDELEDLLTDESAVLDAEDDNPVVVEYLLLEYKSWLLNSSVAVKFDLCAGVEGAGSETVDLACEL
jgi:hypothetical protein